jgi:uncharacterized membrane protein (DUF2068 family)
MSAPTIRVAPWEDFVLRVIAVYKLLHAAFFIAVGFGLLKLRHHNVVEVLNHYVIIPYHLNPEGRFVDWLLDQAEKVSPHMLFLLGWAAFLYAALFAAEGIGLYLRRHWAEYLVVIVTGSLLPIEIYELIHKAAMWKLAAVIGNLAIVSYLIHRLILDARFKKARAEREARESKGESPSPSSDSGLNGNASTSSRHATTKVR